MTKIEHVQFLVLLIPTFLILAAAAVSMADLGLPAEEARPQAMMVAVSGPLVAGEPGCGGSPAESSGRLPLSEGR
jgi:hypothetical protein